jgi:hypothetical protein
MTLPPLPSPAEVALMLAVTLAASLGAILLAGWLRRRAPALAGLLFFLAAATLILTGFSLVYPHHHHDTNWTGNWDLSYPIDAAIGVVFWGACVVAYFRVWKRSGAAEVR